MNLERPFSHAAAEGSRSRRVAQRVCVFATLAACTLARPAVADTSGADLASVRKKFDQALALEQAGDCKAALPLLRDVELARPSSQVRFHVALCLERTGRLVDAREAYLRAKDDADVREGDESLDLAKKCASAASEMDERIPRVEIRVPEDIVSARWSVDGGPPQSVIASPIVRLDPGTHTLTISSPGRRSFERTLKVKERDATVVLKVDLPPDEDAIGEPATDARPAPRPVARRDEPATVNTLPWVLGGTGLAALATSGVFYALRDSTIHRLDDACGPSRADCPRSEQSTEDRGRLYTTTANIFLGVGSAALIGGVVLYVAQPRPAPRAQTLRASVGASNGGWSLVLAGSF